jgi:hypothetical protein
MKKNGLKFFSSLAFVACVTLVYTGCKKEEDPRPENYNSASDNAAADNAFAGIWKQVSTVTDSSNNLRAMASGCATATITPWDATTWPKTVTIDFGPTNCLGSDLVYRRGQIQAVFSGPCTDSGTVITITPINFYHNDYKIVGVQTITNKGHIMSGHLVYGVVVNSAQITNPSGGVSTWSTNQDREWFAGESTSFNIFDDIWKVYGTANGVSVDGKAYTISVDGGNPLQVNVGCPWIVKGKFTLTMNDYPTYPIVVDYGTGGCDANATALFDGTTYNIVMN